LTDLPNIAPNLTTLYLNDTSLGTLVIPNGFTSLSLGVNNAGITNLILPPSMSSIGISSFNGNPLRSISMPETMFFDPPRFVQVYRYPVNPTLIITNEQNEIRITIGAPPGQYRVETSSNLQTWTGSEVIQNDHGLYEFTRELSPEPDRKFFRVVAPVPK
jgi:hypothetical protein